MRKCKDGDGQTLKGQETMVVQALAVFLSEFSKDSFSLTPTTCFLPAILAGFGALD
jgi:hypothetical protein